MDPGFCQKSVMGVTFKLIDKTKKFDIGLFFVLLPKLYFIFRLARFAGDFKEDMWKVLCKFECHLRPLALINASHIQDHRLRRLNCYIGYLGWRRKKVNFRFQFINRMHFGNKKFGRHKNSVSLANCFSNQKIIFIQIILDDL